MSLYTFLTVFLLLQKHISCKPQNDLDIDEEIARIRNEGINECSVIELNSGQSKPCLFLFVFENQTFYGCTLYQDEKPWCSTKIDPLDYEHVIGNKYWGYCPLPLDECPTDEKGLDAENTFHNILESSKYLHNTYF